MAKMNAAISALFQWRQDRQVTKRLDDGFAVNPLLMRRVFIAQLIRIKKPPDDSQLQLKQTCYVTQQQSGWRRKSCSLKASDTLTLQRDAITPVTHTVLSHWVSYALKGSNQRFQMFLSETANQRKGKEQSKFHPNDWRHISRCVELLVQFPGWENWKSINWNANKKRNLRLKLPRMHLINL